MDGLAVAVPSMLDSGIEACEMRLDGMAPLEGLELEVDIARRLSKRLGKLVWASASWVCSVEHMPNVDRVQFRAKLFTDIDRLVLKH